MSEMVAGAIKARDARIPAARFISDTFISRVAASILRSAMWVPICGLDDVCSFMPDSAFRFISMPSLRGGVSSCAQNE